MKHVNICKYHLASNMIAFRLASAVLQKSSVGKKILMQKKWTLIQAKMDGSLTPHIPHCH